MEEEKLKRFYPYQLWEDYQHGMYKKPTKQCLSLVDKSIELFSSTDLLKAAMKRVVDEWPIATTHNFHNGSLNRRSWLGQAACCIDHGIPELINRNAWNALTHEQMKEANRVADEVINYWEKKNEEVFRDKRIGSSPKQGVLDF